jgi:hypothetical protein
MARHFGPPDDPVQLAGYSRYHVPTDRRYPAIVFVPA